MSKIFIFSLSDDIRSKQTVAYRYKEKEYKNQYMLEILLQENDFDKIICFGKPESSWDYLYEKMWKKYKTSELDKSNIEYLQTLHDIESVQDMFQQYFPNKISIQYMEKEKDYTKDDMINDLYEFRKEMSSSEEIYIDITGGMRPTPIIILQLVYLMNKQKKQNVDIKVIYGKQIKQGLFEILELNDFVEKIDYINRVSKFLKYGNPKYISPFFTDKFIKEKLEELYIYTQYNLAENIKTTLGSLLKKREKKYPSFIQKLVIESKLKEWASLFSFKGAGLERYQLSLHNKALSMVVQSEKIKKQETEIIKDLNIFRNSIVHPYSFFRKDKNRKYNEVKINDFEKKYLQELKKGNNINVLITNIGNSNYKKAEVIGKGKSLKTKFVFRFLLENHKYDKVFFLGKYSSQWNQFIDDYILEKGLSYKRKYDYKITSENYSGNISNLNDELQQIDPRFQAILFDNAYDVEDRNRYFEDIFNGLVVKNKKYRITYDMTHGFRDDSFLNYINIYILEILEYLEIKEIYYGEYDRIKNQTILKDMNKINAITNLFQAINDFEEHNKYDDKIAVNPDLKKLMKKISLLYNYNQMEELKMIQEEISQFKICSNKIEEELIEYLKKTYIIEEKDKYNAYRRYTETQLRFGNLGLAIYLLWDILLISLLKTKSQQKKYRDFKHIRFKESFLEQADLYGFPELKNFYNKYSIFSKIRKESAHVNHDKIDFKIDTLEQKLINCFEELEILKDKRDIYTAKYCEYVEEQEKGAQR